MRTASVLSIVGVAANRVDDDAALLAARPILDDDDEALLSSRPLKLFEDLEVDKGASADAAPKDVVSLMDQLGSEPTPQHAASLLEGFAEHAVTSDLAIDKVTVEALKTLKAVIVGTSERVIVANHKTDQQALNTHAAAVAKCDTTYDDSQGDHGDLKDKLTKDEEAHKNCRCDLDWKFQDKKKKCGDLAAYSFKCELSSPPINDGRHAWFDNAEVYIKNERKRLNTLVEECDAATTAYTNKLKECNEAQAELEKDSCSLRLQVHESCATYQNCFNDHRALLLDTIEAVDDNEMARWIDAQSTQKIKCFIDVLLHAPHHKGNATLGGTDDNGDGTVSSEEAVNTANTQTNYDQRVAMFNDCRSKFNDINEKVSLTLENEHTPFNLKINYPTAKAAPDTCTMLSDPFVKVYPGIDDWDEKYKWKSGVRTCTHVATMPAPFHETLDATACPALPPHAIPGNKFPTLLMKVSKNGGNTFHYDSSYWTDDELLNENSAADVDEHAKYAAFLNTPIKKVRMCMGGPSVNCVDHELAHEFANAKELFSAGFVKDEKLDRDGIIEAFGVTPGSYQVCPMQHPGFNLQCRDNNRARWGFCTNCASQPCQGDGSGGEDSDAAIGIGLHGQNTGKQSSGWTGYFASGAGTCSSNSRTEVSVWFYSLGMFTSQEVLVMKVSKNGGNELAYDSALWENKDTLNPSSPHDADEHAKYATFHTVGFKTVKMCMGGPQGSANAKCVVHELAQSYGSALDLFTSGYVKDEKLDRDGIITAFGVTPGSYQVCPMQHPGFNLQCRDNNRARWGFCTNCASQGCQGDGSGGEDSDAAIGIGLHGQNTGKQSSGWTGYFASGAGTCSSNSRTEVSVWFYSLGMFTSQEVLVMKVSKNGGNELAYDSALWENKDTLNPSSPHDADEHAKYATFHTVGFKTVKMCMGGPQGSANAKCVVHELAQSYGSALDLFTSGYVKDEKLDRDGIITAFGVTPGSYQVCPMQHPGFNLQCRDNNRARWGFCTNCASQGCQGDGSGGEDSDASIGIGLHGQNTGAQSSGWTGYFASGAGTCSSNSRTEVSVWFYVVQN